MFMLLFSKLISTVQPQSWRVPILIHFGHLGPVTLQTQ